VSGLLCYTRSQDCPIFADMAETCVGFDFEQGVSPDAERM